MNSPIILRIAGISGALAVAMGAFGAHALKSVLDSSSLDNWKTASWYHFVHTLALLALAYLPLSPKRQRISMTLFLLGILCFSGSLYLLSTRTLHNLPVGLLGPVTPIGGLLLVTAWLSLAWPGKQP